MLISDWSSDVCSSDLGRANETNRFFPLKTNVNFGQVINRMDIRLRKWERGGVIALGSGSCSSGAAVNGMRRGLLDHCVEVQCDGGSVTVQWDGLGPVFLIGPVEATFSGVISDGFQQIST